MKKFIKIITVLVISSGMFSCKKAFEDQPLNITTEDYVWDKTDPTGNQATIWVNKIYSQLPTGYTRVNDMLLDCATDDGVPSNPANGTWNVINGGYGPLNTFDDNWSNCYSAIRRSNMFLQNYQRVPWGDPVIPRWLAAEVRVLRAYFYYDLIKRYGGVPLLGDKVFEPTDPALFQLQRSSFQDCVNYIVSELDAVKDLLRPDATLASRGSGNGAGEGNDSDAGRMRKSIALAIKAKVLLLAASPLFNGTTTPERLFTGYPAFDRDRWRLAAEAAKTVMDLNLFALEPNRYLLNTTRVNKEFVFMRYGPGYATDWGNLMSPVGYQVGTIFSRGLVSPTQELVDAFPMKNGKAITETGSGYDAANPYANRDPRLNQTVFYNGATWLRRPVELFEDGKDKPNNSTNGGISTSTGYYLKKFLGGDDNNTQFTPVMYHPTITPTFCLIRYADILLMYAEAQNEFTGPDASVYAAIEAVRQRAGLVPFALPAGLNQAQMRNLIRNELRVEFAFEEHRFFDIRRWKIAENVYTTPLHGVRIVKNANGTFTYTSTTVATPYFNSNNMYLLPIANSEILVNTNMKQNPNY